MAASAKSPIVVRMRAGSPKNSGRTTPTARMPQFVNNRVCPFGHRAWLSLEFHKQAGGLDYTFKSTSLSDKPQWFTDIYRKALGADVTSTGKVPVIQDGDVILTESAVIARYVDDKFAPASGVSLAAASALDKAKVTLFVDSVAGPLIKAFYTLLKAQDPADHGKLAEDFTGALRAIGSKLLANDADGAGGPFFLGSQLGFAETLVWPWIRRVNALTVHRGYNIPAAGEDAALARFHTWKEAIEAHPAVQGTFEEGDEEFYAEVYTVYANPKKE